MKAILSRAKEKESAELLFEHFVPDDDVEGLISREAFSNAMKSISPEFAQVSWTFSMQRSNSSLPATASLTLLYSTSTTVPASTKGY